MDHAKKAQICMHYLVLFVTLAPQRQINCDIAYVLYL